MNKKETATRQVNFSALSPVIQKPALSSWCVFLLLLLLLHKKALYVNPRGDERMGIKLFFILWLINM